MIFVLKVTFPLEFSVSFGVFAATEDRFIFLFVIQISAYLLIISKCLITLETTCDMKKNECKKFLVLSNVQTINAT
jgi:hypothetical protein